MPYRISPEQDGVWNLRATVTREPVVLNNYKRFIPSFLIPGEFNSQFVAVGIKVTGSGENWRFGGFLSQEFNFSTSGYREEDKAFFRTEDLMINNVTLLKLPVATDKPYRLRFFPPTWFRDLTLEIWEYTGTVVIDNGGSSPGLTQLIERLENTVINGFSSNKLDLGEIAANNVEERLIILTQLQQIDAGIYTLAEGLSNLLPPQQAQELKQTAQNRLDLDLGFL